MEKQRRFTKIDLHQIPHMADDREEVIQTIGICKQTPAEVFRVLFQDHVIGSYKGLNLNESIEGEHRSTLTLLIDEYDPLPGTIVTGDVLDFDYNRARTPGNFRHQILQIRRILVYDMKIFDELDSTLRAYEDRVRRA